MPDVNRGLYLAFRLYVRSLLSSHPSRGGYSLAITNPLRHHGESHTQIQRYIPIYLSLFFLTPFVPYHFLLLFALSLPLNTTQAHTPFLAPLLHQGSSGVRMGTRVSAAALQKRRQHQHLLSHHLPSLQELNTTPTAVVVGE